MARMRDYDDELAAAVVDGLAAGKTFRGVAAECGVSLGMVQRIWAIHCATLPATGAHT